MQTMADISGIEKAVRVALGGAVTSVTWSSRGAVQQQQQMQMQGRMDAQRSFATSSAGLGTINQPYGGVTSSMTSQQVRLRALIVSRNKVVKRTYTGCPKNLRRILSSYNKSV